MPVVPPVAQVIELAVERTGWSRRKLANELGIGSTALHRLSKGQTTKVDLGIGLRLLELAGIAEESVQSESSKALQVLARLDKLDQSVEALSITVLEAWGLMLQALNRQLAAGDLLARGGATLKGDASTTELPVDRLSKELGSAIEALRTRSESPIQEMTSAPNARATDKARKVS